MIYNLRQNYRDPGLTIRQEFFYALLGFKSISIHKFEKEFCYCKTFITFPNNYKIIAHVNFYNIRPQNGLSIFG